MENRFDISDLLQNWRRQAKHRFPDIPFVAVAVHSGGAQHDQPLFGVIKNNDGSYALGIGDQVSPNLLVLGMRAGRVQCFESAIQEGLVYRASTSLVEKVFMPETTSGAARHKPEAARVIETSPGDVILLIGDEFARLESPEGRRIGPDRAAEELAIVGSLDADEIRAHFELICRAWTAAKAGVCIPIVVMRAHG